MFLARNDDTKTFCCEKGHESRFKAQQHIGAARKRNRVLSWSLWRSEGGKRSLLTTSGVIAQEAAEEVERIAKIRS